MKVFQGVVCKIISLATSVLFVLQTVVFAQPVSFTALNQLDGITVAPANLNLQIPESLGVIRNVYKPSQPDTSMIVHIQDAHANRGVQENMYKIISYLEEQHGFELVFVEGADRKISYEEFHLMKSKELNLKLADSLVKDGIFGGAELYAARKEESGIEIYGVEDLALYHENVRTFRSIIEAAEESKEFLQYLKNNILSAASRKLTTEFNQYFRDYVSYQDETMELQQYMNVVSKQAKTALNVDFSEPFIQRIKGSKNHV